MNRRKFLFANAAAAVAASIPSLVSGAVNAAAAAPATGALEVLRFNGAAWMPCAFEELRIGDRARFFARGKLDSDVFIESEPFEDAACGWGLRVRRINAAGGAQP